MIRLTSKLATALEHHASLAAHQAYCEAADGIKLHKVAPSQTEAWHVAKLCACIRRLAGSWRTELASAMPGATLSMSSVFTHQKPYAQWPKRLKGHPRCELADLLVAVIDRRPSAANGMAILVQAKLSDDEDVSLTKLGELKQFELLSKRPTFDIDENDAPSAVRLDGKEPDSALMYGLAARHAYLGWPHIHKLLHGNWLVADALGSISPTSPIHIHAPDSFASLLVGLLQGSYGWEFKLSPGKENWKYFAEPSTRDDWSMLINYLLEDAFNGSMSDKLQIPAGQKNRGKEEQLFFSAQGPHSSSMFLITDGLSEISPKISVASGESLEPFWKSNSLALGDDNGGGDGGQFNVGRDEPQSGPISALVIEIGSAG